MQHTTLIIIGALALMVLTGVLIFQLYIRKKHPQFLTKMKVAFKAPTPDFFKKLANFLLYNGLSIIGIAGGIRGGAEYAEHNFSQVYLPDWAKAVFAFLIGFGACLVFIGKLVPQLVINWNKVYKEQIPEIPAPVVKSIESQPGKF